MAVRNVDTLVEEVRVVGLEGVLLGSDWPGVREVAFDCLDTAGSLGPADQESADNLAEIARLLSSAGLKMAAARIGYKGGAVKTKLGHLHRVRTAVLVGLRGRG